MRNLKIVVVDDSYIVRDHLSRAISQMEGCSLIGMAEDGFEALTMIRALKPDLVILDISMPHRDGIEVLRDVRKEDSDVVIVMFTADPSIGLEQVCLESGADYYLDKAQLRELLAICRKHLLELQNDTESESQCCSS